MASQKNRHMAIVIDLGDQGQSTGSGDDDVLLLRGIRGTSGISSIFSYELELLSSKSDLGDSALHKNTTIEFRKEDGSVNRYINGIIFTFSTCGVAFIDRDNDDQMLYLYRAQLMPELTKMTMTHRTKVYHDQDIKTIVSSVFSTAQSNDGGYVNPLPAGYCDTSGLTGDYEPMACCVQYQESDFDFISRLMEAAGISYFFTHQQGRHTMKLSDNNNTFNTRPNPLNFNYEDNAEGVFAFQKEEHYIPFDTSTYPKARDFSYTLMDNSFNGKLGDVSGDPNAIFNIYSEDARFLKDNSKMASQIANFAQFRRDEYSSAKDEWIGKTHVMDIYSGLKFTMNNFPSENAPAVNILVAKMDTVSQCKYDLEAVNNDDTDYSDNLYEVEFNGRDSQKTFRPSLKTPKPQIFGLQTGRILTNALEDANVTQTDKYARVKVKPQWGDKLTESGEEYCWARVAQMRANAGNGMFTVPRVGEEVVISFVDGKPEEPLVVGSVYNSHCKPPMSVDSTSSNQPDLMLRSSQVSKENTWSGGEAVVAQSEPVDEIKMSDLKKGKERKGYHELSLIDTEDKERVGLYSNGEILTQAPEDIIVKAGKKITIEAGEEIELKVGSTTLEMNKSEVHIKRGINSDFKMSNLSIDMRSWEITANGILGAKIKSLMSSVLCEPLSVDIYGLETSTKAGLLNIGTIKSFIAAAFGFPKMLGAGTEASEDAEFGINMVFTATSLLLLREGKALLGASFISQAGSEVKIKAGFASVFSFPVPVIPPGELTIMTTELHKTVLGEENEEVVEHEEVVAAHEEEHVEHEAAAVEQEVEVVQEDHVAAEQEVAVVDANEEVVVREADAVAENRNAAAVEVVVAAQDENLAVDERAVGVENREAAVENVVDVVDIEE